MNNLMSKLKRKNSTNTMWQTQYGKFMTTNTEKVDLCLMEFSATKIMTWKFHVDDYIEIRYAMILGRDLLTTMVIGIKFSEIVILGSARSYEGCS